MTRLTSTHSRYGQQTKSLLDNSTCILFESTLTRARNLNAQVYALANGLAEVISSGREQNGRGIGIKRQGSITPIWTVGPAFVRKFQNQVRTELEALEKLSPSSPHNGVPHRLRSTNLPNLEAIWAIFGSGQYSGVISLGSSVKPGGHGGYCGDLLVDYGEHIVKISKVTAHQLKRELGTLMTEMADNEGNNFRVRDWIPYLDVCKMAQKVAQASDVAEPIIEDLLSASDQGFPRILRHPVRKFKRQVTIAFCNTTESEEDLELIEAVKAELELHLNVKVQLFDLTRVEILSTSELVMKVIAGDTRYFKAQIPPVLNFDVTGLLCIVSDITNLDPDRSHERLESQRHLATGRYRKSGNAFVFLKRQIEAEKCRSVMDTILSLVCASQDSDRRIFTCSASVKEKLLDLVSKMGSSEEKRRTQLLFNSDVTLRNDREETLTGIPNIIVFDASSSTGDVGAIDEVLVADKMLGCAAEFGGREVMTVTGNYKMAKQLRSRLDWKFSRGILVVNSRSLLGGG
ncbi:hypothetical protein POJ06DRAFT_269381 [Lipomyces tetrasporus]|uniref:Uncharacterized protein n=1 Tax=Lipomyces tetrasporus TaxID=54092 RepID=A0AAD7QQ21_9ASCO|nr:uncharacterized protein POJ06DRAFT_269381 [Lipomyces tetrasporus]KAJ8099320.1 hypothetical protein POJ06DRAFT_269381 [Lipomyces tetrasporus]